MTTCYPLPLLLPRAVFLFIIPPLSSKARFLSSKRPGPNINGNCGEVNRCQFFFLFYGNCYFTFFFLRADCDEVSRLRRLMVGRVDIFKGLSYTEEGCS
jgi:hypothetical protein